MTSNAKLIDIRTDTVDPKKFKIKKFDKASPSAKTFPQWMTFPDYEAPYQKLQLQVDAVRLTGRLWIDADCKNVSDVTIQLHLDPSQEQCVKLEKICNAIDAFNGSDVTKNLLFTDFDTNVANSYTLSPLVRTPSDESKNRMNFIKLKFHSKKVENNMVIATKMFVENKETGVNEEIDLNAATLDDLKKYFTSGTVMNAVLGYPKIWALKNKYKNKLKYGSGFKLMLCDVVPGNGTENSSNKLTTYSFNKDDEYYKTNRIIKSSDFDPSKLDLQVIDKESEMQKKMKKQYMSFPSYNGSNVTYLLEGLLLTDHGVPSKGNEQSGVIGDEKRAYLKLPLDPNQPCCVAYENFISMCDEKAKEKISKITGEPSDKFVFNASIKNPSDINPDVKDRLNYARCGFDVEFESNKMKTLAWINENGEPKEIKFETISDIEEFIKRGCKINAIITYSIFRVSKTVNEDKKYECGNSFKIKQIEIFPNVKPAGFTENIFKKNKQVPVKLNGSPKNQLKVKTEEVKTTPVAVVKTEPEPKVQTAPAAKDEPDEVEVEEEVEVEAEVEAEGEEVDEEVAVEEEVEEEEAFEEEVVPEPPKKEVKPVPVVTKKPEPVKKAVEPVKKVVEEFVNDDDSYHSDDTSPEDTVPVVKPKTVKAAAKQPAKAAAKSRAK